MPTGFEPAGRTAAWSNRRPNAGVRYTMRAQDHTDLNLRSRLPARSGQNRRHRRLSPSAPERGCSLHNEVSESIILCRHEKSRYHIDMYPENWTHLSLVTGTNGCFPIFYGRHPFCFCLDPFVVIVFDIFFHRLCKDIK